MRDLLALSGRANTIVELWFFLLILEVDKIPLSAQIVSTTLIPNWIVSSKAEIRQWLLLCFVFTLLEFGPAAFAIFVVMQ